MTKISLLLHIAFVMRAFSIMCILLQNGFPRVVQRSEIGVECAEHFLAFITSRIEAEEIFLKALQKVFLGFFLDFFLDFFLLGNDCGCFSLFLFPI